VPAPKSVSQRGMSLTLVAPPVTWLIAPAMTAVVPRVVMTAFVPRKLTRNPLTSPTMMPTPTPTARARGAAIDEVKRLAATTAERVALAPTERSHSLQISGMSAPVATTASTHCPAMMIWKLAAVRYAAEVSGQREKNAMTPTRTTTRA